MIAIKKVTAGVSADRPTVGYPGQIYIVYSATAAPELTIWDNTQGDWVELNPDELEVMESMPTLGQATASKYLTTDATNNKVNDASISGTTWTFGGLTFGYEDTTIANAAVKTLNATNVDLTAAPGAANFLVFLGAICWYDYATAAFDAVGAGDELEIEVETSGKVVSFLEAVGFADQGADEVRYMAAAQPTGAVWDYDGTAHLNKKLQASVNTGSWFAAAGGAALKFRVFWIKVPSTIADFSSEVLT